MACTNANANDSNDEVTVYQPLDQVTQVERDEHLMTVDGQESGNTVVFFNATKRANQSNQFKSCLAKNLIFGCYCFQVA